MRAGEWIKENVVPQPPLSTWWVCAGVAASLVALAAVAFIDHALPAPLSRDTAPTDRFIADIAHEHLVNLTSMGPRVAGSYENEVAAVAVLLAALKRIAAAASPYNRVELDLQTASGAFPLTFLDGMNNVYRDVQNVVARVSSAGGRARPGRRSALLLNCHYDTVPDSPGASDDGAGCAVLLETLRALAATTRELRHDVIFLFNGAEENIMQASHGFITQHKWARSVRAFINIEACGAGGREVLFQAGPHDPWIMEVYASAVPYPFASSLAQELFESGLIPADTDFRIFRDFGNLSGVDLAWSANGYVYHTRLDTAERVPRASLQRTGDNVLALVHGILLSGNLDTEVDPSSRQPVFFDVLGAHVVSARAPAATAAAVVVVAAVLFRIHLNATSARKHLYVRRRAWWATVWHTLTRAVAAHAAGTATAVALALLLHAAGARLAFYSRPWLLAPMYALPAVSVTWLVALRGRDVGGAVSRGWWAARAWEDAAGAGGAALTAAAAATALRCGFLPLLWAAPIALSGILAHLIKASEGARAVMWCAASALPALQTWYLALNTLRMFVPITGRAGDAPADAALGALVAALVLPAAGWLLPLVIASRRPHRLIYAGLCVCAATCALVTSAALGTPYAPDAPQRLMVFHTRRTLHAAPPAPRDSAALAAHTDLLYWVPTLDVNTPHSVDKIHLLPVPEMRSASLTSAQECARWVHCGAPYYLPVLSFISRGHWLPARASPLPVLEWTLAAADRSRTVRELHLNITGPAHIVVIVSPAEGASVSWSNVAGVAGDGGAAWAPLEGPRWGTRRTYFFALHAARRPYHWQLTLHIEHKFTSPPERWADLSLAGHSLFGEHKLHAQHAELLAACPAWVAATGWGVDLHLLTV